MFHPSIRHLTIAQRVAVVSFFGQLFFFVPVMTPYLRDEGLTLAQIAGLQTMLLWAQLVMEIPTGVLADRFGHRRSYQVALGMVVASELWFAFSHTYPMFLIAQVIAGTAFAFASGSVDAYIYESLDEARRMQRMQQARGLVGAATHAGSVVAYATTSFVAANLGHSREVLTLWMGIVALSIAFGLGLSLREHGGTPVHARRPRPHVTSLALMRDGIGVVRGRRALQRVVLLAILANAFGAHLLVFYQQYFLQAGVSGRWFGLALSLGSLVAVGAQLHAWRLIPRLGLRAAMTLAAGMPGAIYLLMAVTTQPLLAVCLFVLQWGAIQLSAPLFSGLYNAQIPDGARATVLSLISGVTTVYVGLMGIFLGWLAEVSLAWMFAIMGAIVLVGTVCVRLGPAVEERSPAGAEALEVS